MSEARRPRYVVKIDGKTYPVLTCKTVNNSHFQADTFDFGVRAYNSDIGLDYWDGAGTVSVEILLGFLQDSDPETAIPSDLTSLITGEVDDVDLHLDTGEVSISGRDLTARFIDTKVAQSWPDHTASQIVQDLAGQVGVDTDITPTKTPVGKYGNGAYNALRRDIPMWDLITYLAEMEGFDAYMSRKTLYFGPPKADDSAPFVISVDRPQSGAIVISSESLKLHRSLTLAKDIVVTVLSYDAGKKQPIKAVAKRQGSAKAASTSFRAGKTSQNYVIRRAGMTQQQAQTLAQNTLTDLSKHERTIEFRIPPDVGLTSRTKAKVTGTNTGFDTDYFIDTVTRDYSFGRHSVTATAKNHQVESQPDA